jgi:excisionase family DNA binding protein
MQTKEQYPLVMTAKHVSEILGCSLRVAYEVMEQKGFPLIRVGRHKKVNRDAFFRWMESQAN